MSNILVAVDEQNLHIIEAPKIAAQGVKENYIIFSFDSSWSGFSKVALFYREKTPDDIYESVIDADGYALVPHEVTDQDGKICFCVAGVKDDMIYTSEILKYKIVKGLYTAGQETAPPTPGIYEQILQSMSNAPRAVNSLSDMTNTAKTYMYRNHWYYYDWGLSEWVDGGQYGGIASEEQMHDNIYDWLDEHPEATTTVQDASLTVVKFTDGLKFKTIKDYVTPEMFGAVGDGVTDDTIAVLAAVQASDLIYLPKTYKITQSIVLSEKKTLRCDGKLKYRGESSAIVITTSYCNVYVNQLETNKNGIELRPSGTSSATVNCSLNVVRCDNVLCNGDNGIGLFINCASGCVQFCEFTFNRIQGGFIRGTNDGLRIVTGEDSSKYCNGNLFDVRSICFCDRAIKVISNNIASCIENRFINLVFEENNYSLDLEKIRCSMSACFEEQSCGKIKISDSSGAFVNVSVLGNIRESVFEIDNTVQVDSYYHFDGMFYDNNGNFLCDGLYITKWGTISPALTTPTYTLTTLTKLFGGRALLYISDGNEIEVPSVRRSGVNNPLSKYEIYYRSATGNATFTLKFTDGTTKEMTITNKYSGIIVIVPNYANNGQWVYSL